MEVEPTDEVGGNSVRPFFRILVGLIGGSALCPLFFELKPLWQDFPWGYSIILVLSTIGLTCFLLAFVKNLKGIHFGSLFAAICVINSVICILNFGKLNFSLKVFLVLCIVYIIYFVVLFGHYWTLKMITIKSFILNTFERNKKHKRSLK